MTQDFPCVSEMLKTNICTWMKISNNYQIVIDNKCNSTDIYPLQILVIHEKAYISNHLFIL